VNVDTSEFAVIAGHVEALEAAYAELARRVEQATTVEAILRNADLPAPGPADRPARPRHLRVVRP
jgi:hypothetical protein